MIRTRSGKYMDLVFPDAGSVCIQDIASHLGGLCRFTGATKRFYSVAEHSVLVSRLIVVSPSVQMFGLLHDASEAYLGDVSTPLKRSGLLGDYSSLEEAMQRTIITSLGLSFDDFCTAYGVIKAADYAAFCLEWKHLMLDVPGGEHWELPAKDPAGMFLDRYEELSMLVGRTKR